jgi:hypothetical protein
MDRRYTLFFKCKILPEYADFIKNGYMYECNKTCEKISEVDLYFEPDAPTTNESPHQTNLSKAYKDLLDIWHALKLSNCFHEYNLDASTNVFTCEISKRVTIHEGHLDRAYDTFLADIIVPITYEIMECYIESDDYCCWKNTYTDMQLRGKHFDLKSVVKSVKHVWENGEITLSVVTYKRSIKAIQEIDLNRSFGQKN